MPTSVFFDTYQNSPEQHLIEDLVNESVHIHGIDFFYIAKTLNNFNKIYDEDDQSSYSNAWLINGQLKDVFGYAGAGNIMSKFGVEIKDQIIVSIPMREFQTEIGSETGYTRCREGDLLFFPLHKKCFEISFVNQLEFFYPLGNMTTWECTCELFQYSGEIFNTGIADIDLLQTTFSQNLYDWAFLDENDAPLLDENEDLILVDGYNVTTIDPMDDSVALATDVDDILDWSIEDPFSDFLHHKI